MPRDPAGHDDVGEDELGLVARRQSLERFLGAVRDRGFEPELAEHVGGELGDERIVLDDQHPAERLGPVRWLCAVARAMAGGKVEGERRHPCRISDSTVTAPPICLAKPNTWLRPRPVPSPKLLVVKKGSNTRSITSGGMPVPVSETREHDMLAPEAFRPAVKNARCAR